MYNVLLPNSSKSNHSTWAPLIHEKIDHAQQGIENLLGKMIYKTIRWPPPLYKTFGDPLKTLGQNLLPLWAPPGVEPVAQSDSKRENLQGPDIWTLRFRKLDFLGSPTFAKKFVNTFSNQIPF